MVTFLCVRTGTKYGPEYVERLRAMLQRNLTQSFELRCITDQPEEIPGVEMVRCDPYGLGSWWAKMLVFNRSMATGRARVFLDLDTVITGNIDPLADLAQSGKRFAICRNFTRAAGNENWPCRYGSCVMTLGAGFGNRIWEEFDEHRNELMQRAGKYGDQQVIEWILPEASILQDELPDGFFLGYRDLTDEPQPEARVVIFAGRSKPDNCDHHWVTDHWR